MKGLLYASLMMAAVFRHPFKALKTLVRGVQKGLRAARAGEPEPELPSFEGRVIEIHFPERPRRLEITAEEVIDVEEREEER